MPLVIETQTSPPFGSFTEIDVTELGVHKAKLAVGYSHAARFEFSVVASNHTLPFTYGTFVRVYDPDGYIDGTSEVQDDENPLFEGFVEEMQPGETNEVRIICYDPTYRSVRKVPLMNAPWELDSNDEPIASDVGYPRVVFNVTQDNDDDYAFSIGQNLTVGGMIQQVLTDGYLPLYHINAAPGDASPEGNGQAFLTDDLGEDTSGSSDWIGGLDFEPQEKVVAHSESLRSFVDRLLSQYDPATKLVWQPGERLWIERELSDGPYVYRYKAADDFGEPAHAFLVCSFWLIDALAAIGRRERARELFERVLACRNHLGLLSEHVDRKSLELWGNFPQTYSHVGLINGAMRLSRAWEEVV